MKINYFAAAPAFKSLFLMIAIAASACAQQSPPKQAAPPLAPQAPPPSTEPFATFSTPEPPPAQPGETLTYEEYTRAYNDALSKSQSSDYLRRETVKTFRRPPMDASGNRGAAVLISQKITETRAKGVNFSSLIVETDLEQGKTSTDRRVICGSDVYDRHNDDPWQVTGRQGYGSGVGNSGDVLDQGTVFSRRESMLGTFRVTLYTLESPRTTLHLGDRFGKGTRLTQFYVRRDGRLVKSTESRMFAGEGGLNIEETDDFDFDSPVIIHRPVIRADSD